MAKSQLIIYAQYETALIIYRKCCTVLSQYLKEKMYSM